LLIFFGVFSCFCSFLSFLFGISMVDALLEISEEQKQDGGEDRRLDLLRLRRLLLCFWSWFCPLFDEEYPRYISEVQHAALVRIYLYL